MTRHRVSSAVSLTVLSLLSTALGQTATWVPIRQTTNENVGGTFAAGRMIVADDARNLLVSFGCQLADATTADTWVWAGSHWSPRDPSRLPARRSDAMFVYDAGRRVVVMFGGTVANGVWVDETWEFDGLTWLLRSLPVRPPARFLTAGAYDRSRGRVVLYGGGQGPLLSDTWEYDGTAWTLRTPASNPGPRQRHRMAYDEARQVVVMHGGEYAYNQTWEWDGTNWSLRSSSGPNLYDFGMAYDRARQRTVAIGSQAFLGSSTFEWDGVNWITGASPPPPDHQGEGLATDPLSGRALLFRDSRLWQWNGLAWTQLAQVEIAPTGLRPQQVWCTDSVRQRVVMHTSSESFLFGTWEGTWEWNGRRGSDCRRVPSGCTPPWRSTWPGNAVCCSVASIRRSARPTARTSGMGTSGSKRPRAHGRRLATRRRWRTTRRGSAASCSAVRARPLPGRCRGLRP